MEGRAQYSRAIRPAQRSGSPPRTSSSDGRASRRRADLDELFALTGAKND